MRETALQKTIREGGGEEVLRALGQRCPFPSLAPLLPLPLLSQITQRGESLLSAKIRISPALSLALQKRLPGRKGDQSIPATGQLSTLESSSWLPPPPRAALPAAPANCHAPYPFLVTEGSFLFTHLCLSHV